MKKLVSILIAFFFISPFLYSEQDDILKEADLMLDMMEYRTAIDYYKKALSEFPGKRDIRKRIGYACFKSKKINEALRFLKEELNLFPDNADAYDLLVHILFKLNKLDEADNFLEKHGFQLKLTENNPYMGGLAHFIIGMHFKELKEYDRAQEYFRKAIEKRHDLVKCYVQLIDMELMQGRLEFANQILIKAGQLYGMHPEFFFMDGLRYFEKSKTNINFLIRVTESFERALELDPYFKNALFNLACLRYNNNIFKKASEYFEQTLKIEPENDEVKIYLDCAIKKITKVIDKESISECPQKINLSREFIENPDRDYKYQLINDMKSIMENINYLGLEFIRNGKLYDAIRVFRNGLKIYPQSPEINFNLGMVFSWLNHFKDAEKHALIALRKKGFFGRLPVYRKQEILRKKSGSGYETSEIPLPDWTLDVALKEGNYFSDAYDLLGNIYFKNGELDKSILTFNKVIEIYPEDAMGHYNLGCSYWALEDWENAEMEWKKAVKYEKVAKEREERAKVSKDQLSISLIVLRRPVAYRARKSLGLLYLKKNLADKALKEFEQAIELEPSDPEPYYELGKMYQAKGDIEKAIFYYEKYLYLGGKKEVEVKELLKSLK
ncbi:Cell division coordinator CpoB [subsurface metagenome]